MRVPVLAAVAASIIGGCAHLQRQAEPAPPEPGAGTPAARQAEVTHPALRAELLRMVEEDQAARNAWIATDLKDKAAGDRMAAVDARNTARMKAIVGATGWPTVRQVGSDGVKAAFLLVQHADGDPAFQARCLPHVEAAARRGELEKQHVALLTDRVFLAQGKPQRYGTQFMTEGDDWVPQPMEDPANVDARRQAMDLPPLAEYKAQLIKFYGRPKPDLAPVPKASPAYSRPASPKP